VLFQAKKLEEKTDMPVGGRGLYRAMVILFMGLYLVLAVWDLESPGMGRDEALMGHSANSIDFVRALKERSLRFLPLQFDNHHGLWMAYAIYPFSKLLGGHPISIRLAAVFYGFLGLSAMFYVTYRIFGRFVALVTLIFLSCHPSFLCATRIGLHDQNIVHLAAAAAAFFLWRWWTEGKTSQFFFSCFFLGMGMGIQTWFIYWLGALAAVALLNAGEVWKRLKGSWRLHVWGGAASFLAGTGPLFLSFVTGAMRPEDTVDYFITLWLTCGSISLSAAFVMRERLVLFLKMLGGGYTYPNHWGLPYDQGWVYPVLFSVGALWILCAAVRNLAKRRRETVSTTPLVFFVAYLLCASFAPAWPKEWHLGPLLPVALLVAGIGLCDLFGNIRRLLWRGVAWGVVCVSVFFSSAMGNYVNYDYLHRTGGEFHMYSWAIYDFADWLRTRGHTWVVTMSPYLNVKLRYLASRNIRTVDLGFRIGWTEKEILRRLDSLRSRADVYVATYWAGDEAPFPTRFPMFNRWRMRQDPPLRLVSVFHERQGRPIYLVYEPEKRRRPGRRPPT